MEPSTELKNVVLRFYAAISSGDVAALERIMSRENDTLVIGTDPSEWWQGYATITKMYRTQLQEMGGVTVVAGDPQAYCEGNVGWVADRAKFKLPDGKEIPFRLTMVVHREDSEWKIVHHHASIGVLNEEAIGKALTV